MYYGFYGDRTVIQKDTKRHQGNSALYKVQWQSRVWLEGLHSEPCVHALSTLNAKHQQPFQVQAGMRCVSGVSLHRFRLFLKNLIMCLRICQVQATGNFLNTPGRISSCSGNIIPVCGHTLHVYIRLAPTKLKWQTF